MVIVHESLCPQNHKCPLTALCPTEAIQQVGFNAPFIVRERCQDCALCADKCPMGAVRYSGETQ